MKDFRFRSPFEVFHRHRHADGADSRDSIPIYRRNPRREKHQEHWKHVLQHPAGPGASSAEEERPIAESAFPPRRRFPFSF